MKKVLGMVLAGVLAWGMLTDCGRAAHVHAPSETWDRNAITHWRVCECGEKLDVQVHEMDDILCTVCGSEIWVDDDGIADVYDYDENEQLCRTTSYDSDGSIIDDYRYEREYDTVNNTVLEKVYYRGQEIQAGTWALVWEELSTTDAENWYIPIRQTAYYFDGAIESINEYDEYGNCKTVIAYDKMGEVFFEEYYKYVYGEGGEILQIAQEARYSDGSVYIDVFNEYNDSISSILYAADGSVEYNFQTEYGYDERGNMLWSKQYSENQLIVEGFYTVVEDEEASWSYLSSGFEYYEDGSKTFCEYDEDGWVIRGTEYDAEGNIVHSYELDEGIAVG